MKSVALSVDQSTRDREDRAISRALLILDKRLRKPGESLNCPDTARCFFRMRLAELEREVFEVAYLDHQNCLIVVERPFTGTIDSTEVYPREILRSAMLHNASAIIVAHNHPSGNPHPSRADRELTTILRECLRHVGVRLSDHILVAHRTAVSFAGAHS